MSKTDKGARVSLPAREQLPASTQQLYDQIMQSRGMDFIANVFRGLGHSPEALSRVAAVGEHVRFNTHFGDELRELMILTVAQEVRSAYEWTHHYHIAEKLGVDKQTLEAIGGPDIEQRPDPVGAAVRYVKHVARNEEIDDATVESIRSKFGDDGLIDMTVLAGYYVMLGLYLNAMRIPCEVELVAFNTAS